MKPIVFLLDRDAAYAEFLELRLIEKYGNRIDLRVVTDPAYYERLFSVQQKADVALVGENMFEDSLCQHQIRRLVLLCERELPHRDDWAGEKDMVCVSRFSDPRMILNEAFFDLKPETQEGGDDGAGLAQVLTVTSAVGGCGKTSVALALAKALGKHHKRVLYLCAEELQCFGSYIGDPGYLPTDACRVLAKNETGCYQLLKGALKKETFSYLPASFSTLHTMRIRGSAYVRLVREAKASGDFDMIILDPGNCCGQEGMAFLKESDQVFVLVMQDVFSVAKNDAFLRNIDVAPRKYRFICNRFLAKKPNHILRKAMEGYTVSVYVDEVQDMSIDSLAESTGLTELAYMLL